MEIVLYTEPRCSACVDARSFLTSHGLSFEERDIRSNPEYLRILNEELDSCMTPTLLAGDKILIGFDKAEYEQLPVNRASEEKPSRGKADAVGGRSEKS